MKRWKFLAAVIVVIAAASLAACGGSDPSPAGGSPTAPTPNPPTAPAVTGATITGSVQGLAGTSSAVGARNAITVTIVGTNLTSTVDASGNFVITGVPGGTITLAFSGTAATVTISSVGSTDQVKIKIVISGGTATVESEQHQVDGLAQLEGRVSSIVSPDFYVGDTKVVLGTPVTIRYGETSFTTSTELFAVLKVGDRLHAAGTAGATQFTASTITLQNTNAKVPVNLKGAVSGYAGGCDPATFTVEGWTVKAASGVFTKGTCVADLKNGAEVHVKGDVIPATTAPAAAAYVQATWVQFGK